MALELYKEEVSDPGAQKRFKAGSTYVEQFLAKTKTKDLVAASPEDPDADEQKDVYACDECGQTFSAKSSLRHHKVYNHSNADKPFACPHCDRGFKSSENLKIHVRTHTGEKPQTSGSAKRTTTTGSYLANIIPSTESRSLVSMYHSRVI